MKISFLLPSTDEQFATLPITVEDYWPWQSNTSGIHAYWGRYHWVLQTYLYLKGSGMEVSLVRQMPDDGVVITHMDCVEYGFKPGRELLLVVMLVDREVPHPHASIHVTHNPRQLLPFKMAHRYIPPWPQVGMVARSPARGSRFENIGYFGYSHNLVDSLSGAAFERVLAKLGLSMVIPEPTRWHDFSNVDGVLAIRNFGTQQAHLNKPALKLYNAWKARVPAILGFESAYRADGRDGRDYLQATSLDEVVRALEKLRESSSLRAEIVANGVQALERFRPEETLKAWRRFLEHDVAEQFAKRTRSPWPTLKGRMAGALLERVLWRRPNQFGLAPDVSDQRQGQ